MNAIPRAACQAEVDYNTVPVNGFFLPYIIELDTAASNLYPQAGERQRFCYQISAAGQDGNQNLSLERLVLGVNSDLTADDFYSLTVSVNGVSQNVVWGENVRILTAGEPDPETGCTGLLLNFSLDSTNDVMNVCFTLNRILGVGPTRICLYGEGEAVSSLFICGPALLQENSCPTTVYREVDVCVPVTIASYATAGDPTVTCCGTPTITPGTNVCTGTVGGTCSFTISQRVCVAVPVTFGANATTGAYSVTCGNFGEGDCAGCGEPPAPAFTLARGAATCGCQGRRPAAAATQTQLSDILNAPTRRR